MKSNATPQSKPTPFKFPCLMTHPTMPFFVVLMRNICEGMVVYSSEDAPYNIGYYANDWNSDSMVIYDGEVNLFN